MLQSQIEQSAADSSSTQRRRSQIAFSRPKPPVARADRVVSFLLGLVCTRSCHRAFIRKIGIALTMPAFALPVSEEMSQRPRASKAPVRELTQRVLADSPFWETRLDR